MNIYVKYNKLYVHEAIFKKVKKREIEKNFKFIKYSDFNALASY